MSKVIRLNDNNIKLLEEFKEIILSGEKNDEVMKRVIKHGDNLTLEIALGYAIMCAKQFTPSKSPK